MLRGITATGVLAVALTVLSTVPASAADTTTPLRLTGYTTTVTGPPATTSPFSDPACDSGSRLFCGSVAVVATFAGLEGTPRPTTAQPDTNVTGSVDVIRTYGCTDRAGRLLHRFDRVVRETVGLNTRRGLLTNRPSTGDTLTVTTFAFLSDSQPRNCPQGTTAVNTSIIATGANLSLNPPRTAFAGATYALPRWAWWFGVAPAPDLVSLPS